MRRGEVWTVSGGGSYTGKPRPCVIVQEDCFDATSSVTLCAFTTDPTDAPLFRLLIDPTEANGLRVASRLMVDKITTVPKDRLGERIGRLDDADILRLNQAILVFLGLSTPVRAAGWVTAPLRALLEEEVLADGLWARLTGIEACAWLHHWARELSAKGRNVKLTPPHYVKPHVKRQQNDMTDAAAICDAIPPPSIQFDPMKSEE